MNRASNPSLALRLLRLVRAIVLVGILATGIVPALHGAELRLDFATLAPGVPPPTFRAALTGGGPPPEWRVIQVEAASTLPAISDRAPDVTRETVLAQVSQDPTDERFPLLIHQPEEFADFTARLRFRTMSGRVEQMAGLAFRLMDERNYYVIRASSLGNSLRFYKFVDGVRSEPIGPQISIPTGTWHTLEVTCSGNSIRCRLDEREGIPALTDTSFSRGRLALWTKSDSVSHFRSLEVTYEAVRTLPQRLVDRAQERFPRLLGVTIYAQEAGQVVVIAATDPAQVGTRGGEAEAKALADGLIQAGGTRRDASAVFPLRDRNGEPLFALRLRFRTFAGQTDANIAARGRPIALDLEELVRTAERADRTGR